MRRLVVLGAVLVLLGAGCSDDGPDVVSIGDPDEGTTVMLAVGETLELTLSANPSTGYTWEVVGDPVCVAQRGDSRYTALSDSLGGGGELTLTFDAVRSGAEELRLVYHRPWEDVAPERTYMVGVVVAAETTAE